MAGREGSAEPDPQLPEVIPGDRESTCIGSGVALRRGDREEKEPLAEKSSASGLDSAGKGKMLEFLQGVEAMKGEAASDRKDFRFVANLE